jgi:hypothetical protein
MELVISSEDLQDLILTRLDLWRIWTAVKAQAMQIPKLGVKLP